MSESKSLITRTFEQENTTVIKYRIVKLGTSDNQVVAAVDATVIPVGVADESADSTAGNPVGIVMQGIAKITMAAASTKGNAVKPIAAGKGETTTNAGDRCVGWLLETTTVNDQVAKLMVNPFIYAIT